jgi:hypothetical protein
MIRLFPNHVVNSLYASSNVDMDNLHKENGSSFHDCRVVDEGRTLAIFYSILLRVERSERMMVFQLLGTNMML